MQIPHRQGDLEERVGNKSWTSKSNTSSSGTTLRHGKTLWVCLRGRSDLRETCAVGNADLQGLERICGRVVIVPVIPEEGDSFSERRGMMTSISG